MPSTKPDQSENELNLRQEAFCQLYASDREFFGNGTQTYIEAYDIDLGKPNAYKVAQAAASRLLSNVKVCTRINELLEEGGLNDGFVDKQLVFLLTQHDDKGSKLGAIREYNKLKQRVSDRLEHTGKNGDPIETNTSVTYYPKGLPDNYWEKNATTPDAADSDS